MTIKVTIEFEYDPERVNYDREYSKEFPLGRSRTQEEIDALTEQQMADEDLYCLVNGDYSIAEVMDWASSVWDEDTLKKHVKFEAI